MNCTFGGNLNPGVLHIKQKFVRVTMFDDVVNNREQCCFLRAKMKKDNNGYVRLYLYSPKTSQSPNRNERTAAGLVWSGLVWFEWSWGPLVDVTMPGSPSQLPQLPSHLSLNGAVCPSCEAQWMAVARVYGFGDG